MSKAAARVGDPISHGGSISKGSSNVFINGKPAAIVTSEVSCSTDGCQSISKGSATVFINGKPAARVNDTTSCGAAIESGSPDVFIGDSGSPITVDVEADNASLHDLATFDDLAALLGVVPYGAPPPVFDHSSESKFGNYESIMEQYFELTDEQGNPVAGYRYDLFLNTALVEQSRDLSSGQTIVKNGGADLGITVWLNKSGEIRS